MSGKFTYPFRYDPAPEVREAAAELIARIDASPELSGIFAEGKMLGALAAADRTGKTVTLYAFSGLAGGKSVMDGFVPPVADLTAPDGHFRREEAKISELNRKISAEEAESGPSGAVVQALKMQRKAMSDELQKWIFSNFTVMNGLGEKRSVLDIFADCGLVPPGGTGDCAAPKLLNHAFLNGLTPVAMGEFWYGRDTPGKEHGKFYPSCSGKCGPLLRWMLKGVDVCDPYAAAGCTEPQTIYEDEHLLAVEKPAGLICVPGKDGSKSLAEMIPQPSWPVHRLDMDTSGVMLFAKTPRAYREMQRMFENREVEKVYEAIVENRTGLEKGQSGTIDLPLFPDFANRPCQKVDRLNGKPASTEYHVEECFPESGTAAVTFRPRTGRTHQIRVHSSSVEGLGCPVAGDLLYGGRYLDRMMLHARSVKFRHPATGETVEISSGTHLSRPEAETKSSNDAIGSSVKTLRITDSESAK